MSSLVNVTLSFEGAASDNHQIDFYDVADALKGFQRSLAITTHLMLNGEVITQAPSLKNAQILAMPPKEGSWTVAAAVYALYKAGTAPKDTPLGHLIYSGYDFIVSNALGFHVDYDKTLGQQYNEVQRFKSLETLPKITQSQLDSATEKCEHAIKDMHRPIVKTGTANGARIITSFGGQSREISTCLNKDTYQHIATTEESEAPEYFTGRISSFDSNTNKGRIFVPKEARTIPFILIENQYTDMYRDLVGMSLMHNIRNRKSNDGNIRFHAFKLTSRTGTLKSLNVIEVTKVNYEHINDNI